LWRLKGSGIHESSCSMKNRITRSRAAGGRALIFHEGFRSHGLKKPRGRPKGKGRIGVRRYGISPFVGLRRGQLRESSFISGSKSPPATIPTPPSGVRSATRSVRQGAFRRVSGGGDGALR
jgi:hypothetical protein